MPSAGSGRRNAREDCKDPSPLVRKDSLHSHKVHQRALASLARGGTRRERQKSAEPARGRGRLGAGGDASFAARGARAAIGRITAERPGRVIMQTVLGGRRIVDMLVGEQLPRVC
jgi:hypothetical protein